ncbi:MAG: N-acetylmuramoyl-L-alanine amidase family protein [Fimbriimonadales bacterium]
MPLTLLLYTVLAAPAFILCIDPGHPSENSSGNAIVNGLREVAVVWEIANLLKKELADDGVRVVLTKSREMEFVTNRERAEIANRAKADLMLRLHADAGGGSGFTVYYARRAGVVNGVLGPSNTILRKTAAAAKAFFAAFSTRLKGRLKNNGLRGDEQTLIGARQGALTGSIYSEAPSILVEMAFLTSKNDANWMAQNRNRRIMARALAAGVLAVRSRFKRTTNVFGGCWPSL